jgi:hypothetical protein
MANTDASVAAQLRGFFLTARTLVAAPPVTLGTDAHQQARRYAHVA